VFSRGSDIRIADEVVCDNLPRASREARRFAGPANLSIESERAAILRLAVMQPTPSERVVKPLAELQRESDRLTLPRRRHRRTVDIVEQLQSNRSQGQSTPMAVPTSRSTKAKTVDAFTSRPDSRSQSGASWRRRTAST
jgi:hypothetical protein